MVSSARNPQLVFVRHQAFTRSQFEPDHAQSLSSYIPVQIDPQWCSMGNELTRAHQPYLVRQISESSGKDEATIKEFYSTFEKECPSGAMTPEDFSKLYSKVMWHDFTTFVTFTGIWL